MSVGRPRRQSSNFSHGVKLGEFWKTDLQVATDDSNHREDASFTIRLGKSGTSLPYQQPIPASFAKYHKIRFQERITLEGPTGQTWSTVLNPSHQVVRFGKGWRQFSVENHLQGGYQLLFTLVGRLRFLVQFFDHLGKRCTSYPPLLVAQPGSRLTVAQTQRQHDLQSGSQQVVDGGQASHRHARRLGTEGQTSAAVPLMEEHKFDARNGSDDMNTEDEENEALAEDCNNYIFLESDNDDVLFRHPPARKSPLVKPKRNVITLNELLLRKKTKCNQVNPSQMQYNNSSSNDELPDMQKKVKKPVSRKKLTVQSWSPATPPVAGSHNVGASSGSSPAIRLLQQQGCMRFSDIVSKCERRYVIGRERHMVGAAAKRFASTLENENFLVVMRDTHVYQGFHLAIPEKILAATGTERASKVDVCLLDREQAQYKAYWTRDNLCDTPMIDRDAWAKFAVDHTLEEGDVCVFQLFPQPLQSKPAPPVATFLFLVDIFRVVEIPEGQLDF